MWLLRLIYASHYAAYIRMRGGEDINSYIIVINFKKNIIYQLTVGEGCAWIFQ